jgi:hypothetical protein
MLGASAGNHFGDSYGNMRGPLDWAGHGAMTTIGPVFFRVNPA